MNQETKYEKECEIFKYFQIDKKIRYLEEKKNIVTYKFYSRSFTSHIDYTEMGVYSVGFKVDEEVVNLLSTLEVIDKQIERCRYAKKNLDKYISKLDSNSRIKLMKKYENNNFFSEPYSKVDDAIYGEIEEIKEAMMYRFGVWYGQNTIIWTKEDVQEILKRMVKEVAL